MPEDFAVVFKSAERDGDGSKLHGLLETHLRLEHARGIRELSVGLVAAVSMPVWLAAARPAWMAPGLRTLALTFWFVSFVGFVAATISEWRWRGRLERATARRRGDGRRDVGV